MQVFSNNVKRTVYSELCVVSVMIAMMVMVDEVTALTGSNICMVQQKYNITKRVKYRAPMSVRSYVWCLNVPPRCSRWTTEMRDLTKLETEERTAEVADCCPGYKVKDVSCIPICPHGKTGQNCSLDCPPYKWGPNCVYDCTNCSDHGTCSPVTGKCVCEDTWKGERCQTRLPTTTPSVMKESLLTTKTIATTMSTKTEHTLTTDASTLFSNTTLSTTTKTVPKTLQTTTISKISFQGSTMRIPTAIDKPEVIKNNITDAIPTIDTSTTVSTEREELINVDTVTENSASYTQSTETESLTSSVPLLRNVKPNFVTAMITPISTTLQTSTNIPTTFKTTSEETKVLETSTRRQDEKLRNHPTTLKFKPKEIWIRPAQKGESTTDDNNKPFELPFIRYRNATKKETASITTPRTIIVSIIPTSVSYSSFRKLSLTSTHHMQSHSNQHRTTSLEPKDATQSINIEPSSTKLIMIQRFGSSLSKETNSYTSTSETASNSISSVNAINKYISTTTENIISKTTNSMMHSESTDTSVKPMNGTITIAPTVSSTNRSSTGISFPAIAEAAIFIKKLERKFTNNTTESTTTQINEVKIETSSKAPKTTEPATSHEVKVDTTNNITNNKSGMVNIANNITEFINTTPPIKSEDEFPILTEPEHITAVIGEKDQSRSSVDLISVLSIAGGVMMAVITVAVVIVMIERCRKTRYEEVRKMDDIRMKVAMDENDLPPPYVRSIFHTPLPEPPIGEGCHYQPISTLDRKVKQFMRPVVVQNISPIMIENFRGILECHYDHLPRRSHHFDPSQCDMRCSLAPSRSSTVQPKCSRTNSLTESAIEAMKCEAKFEEIDCTTSEPLYAEIPCWRPPSERAVEVNMNGEAVTEL